MFRYSAVLLIATVFALVAITQAAVLETRGGNKGHATFYSVKSSGKPSCNVNAGNSDMVAALSRHRMPKGHGKPCHEKINIKGPNGTIKVKVIDTCAGCDRDDVDLSPKAFEKIAKKSAGKVKIQWSFE